MIHQDSDIAWFDSNTKQGPLQTIENFLFDYPPHINVSYVFFDYSTFHHQVFQQASIVCPEHIKRSVPKRQAEFFFGRLCAQAEMQRYNIKNEIGVGSSREPIWCQGLHGSITHTKTIAAATCVIDHIYRGIGIDIEEIVAPTTIASMSAIVLNNREFELLRSIKSNFELAHLFTIVFSAKESFYKAVYPVVKRYFEFHAIEVINFDFEKNQVMFVIREHLCERLRVGDICIVRFERFDPKHIITMHLW